MPELPEVETTVRALRPHVCGQTVSDIVVRQPKLRWPVPGELAELVRGSKVANIERRAKYMLFAVGSGHVLIHLGMSGSLRLSVAGEPPGPHDHVEFGIGDKWRLRLRDPRRFGTVLWVAGDPGEHRLLRDLGIEPLSGGFDGTYLHRASRSRKVAVKNFIMDQRIVVGVGNIYASEALFQAGVNPKRRAGIISAKRYGRLAECVRSTMESAIAAGGTTLRDFTSGDSSPGYFKQELQAYGREGEPCERCAGVIETCVIGGRSTYYCKLCQR